MSLNSYLVTVFAQQINNDGGCILVAPDYLCLFFNFQWMFKILYLSLWSAYISLLIWYSICLIWSFVNLNTFDILVMSSIICIWTDVDCWHRSYSVWWRNISWICRKIRFRIFYSSVQSSKYCVLQYSGTTLEIVTGIE